MLINLSMIGTKKIKLIEIFLLLLAIAYSFSNIIFGIDFVDTFFMGNLFLHTDGVEIMRPLTQFIAYLTAVCFGKNIIFL